MGGARMSVSWPRSLPGSHELYGCGFAAFVLGNATGRVLFAVGHDRSGSYALPLAYASALLLLAAVATLTLGQYRVPRPLT